MNNMSKCALCDEIFNSTRSLSEHIMAKHTETNECQESFVCALCQRKFQALERLEVHMMVAHPQNDDDFEPNEPQQENDGPDEPQQENDGPDAAFRIRWLNGYKKNSIGILVVNEQAKFAHNKTTAKGALMHFHCLKKGTTKCRAKCTIAVIQNEDQKVFELENVSQIDDHNHSVDVADIIASDMINDMHKEMGKDLTAKPSVVRKKVMREYRKKVINQETWKKVIDILPDDSSVDRGIARVREKLWGSLPTNRDELDYQKVLNSNESGNLVEVLDSAKLWNEKSFRDHLHRNGFLSDDFVDEQDASVEEEEDNLPENPLKNVVIFTSKPQLELFETCSKGSCDGNFKIAPTNYSQIFIFMLKFETDAKKNLGKWIPVAFALLPSKEESSYKLFFHMLKFHLMKMNMNIKLEKLIVDFELGIQLGALSAWENLLILACYFHYGQCLLRKVQADKMFENYKNENDIQEFVRQCSALPFVRLNELQDTVDALREEVMDNDEK